MNERAKLSLGMGIIGLIGAGALVYSEPSQKLVLSPIESQSLRDGLNDGQLPINPRPTGSAGRPAAAATAEGGSACLGYVIKKKPISRVEEGSVLVYTYEMSGPGCSSYQLVVVPSQESKALVVGLLKGLNVIKGPESVSTLKERVDGDNAEAKYREPRVAQLTADLQGHAAIVELYVNKDAPALNP